MNVACLGRSDEDAEELASLHVIFEDAEAEAPGFGDSRLLHAAPNSALVL